MKSETSLLTVIGKDRPGIIARVTEELFRQGCNLEDVSMTILEGEFAMILVVSFAAEKKERIRQAFKAIEKERGLSFFWKDVRGRLVRGEKHGKNSESYLITAAGRDRTGIVYKISRELAGRGLNITDLNSRILGRGRSAVYVMMLEADIPKKFKIAKLTGALRKLASELRVDIRIKPVERVEL